MAKRAAAIGCAALCALALAACGGPGAGARAGTGRASPAPTVAASGSVGRVSSEATTSPVAVVSPPTDPGALPTTPGGGGSPPVHICAPPYPSGPPTTTTVFCADPSAMEAATVIRIVDGDTIHVLLNGKDETIRFYGIDTTERGEACFAEGSERTRELVGHDVRLRPDARERDRYGRLLRYVYTPAGLSVGAEMVAEGLAHAWRADGALRVPIIALEEAARAGRVGCLWH